MTDIPPEAVERATAAIMAKRNLRAEHSRETWARPLAVEVLDAAAPLLAEADRRTIVSLLDTIARAEEIVAQKDAVIANRDREIEQLRNQLMALEAGP